MVDRVVEKFMDLLKAYKEARAVVIHHSQSDTTIKDLLDLEQEVIKRRDLFLVAHIVPVKKTGKTHAHKNSKRGKTS